MCERTKVVINKLQTLTPRELEEKILANSYNLAGSVWGKHGGYGVGSPSSPSELSGAIRRVNSVKGEQGNTS